MIHMNGYEKLPAAANIVFNVRLSTLGKTIFCTDVPYLVGKHKNPEQYAKRLEEITEECWDEFFNPDNIALITHAIPAVAYSIDDYRLALEKIRSFAGNLLYSERDDVLKGIMAPIAICSDSVDDMQELLDTTLISIESIKNGTQFSFLSPYMGFLKSVDMLSPDDFQKAVVATVNFFHNARQAYKFADASRILAEFLKPGQLTLTEYMETVRYLGRNIKFLPPVGPAIIAELGPRLMENIHLYARLSSVSIEYIPLIREIKQQKAPVDMSVNALIQFYYKVKDTEEYRLCHGSETGSDKIWQQFIYQGLLSEILGMNEYYARVSFGTHEEHIVGRAPYVRIDKVTINIDEVMPTRLAIN